MNMLVFHNDSDTSYANYAGNLSSMSSATTAVTLRFLGQGAAVTATSTDAVVLTVTAGQEEQVMEDLAGAMADLRAGMTVIADDKNSKYLVPGITAVSSISVDSGAGTFKNVVVGAFSSNNITLTTAQSGSLVTIPTTGAASTITLPTTPPDGTNYHLMCEANNGAHEIEIAGDFEGIVLDNTHATTLDNTSDITIGQSDFKAGDWLELTYRATAASWHVVGAGITDDWITAS